MNKKEALIFLDKLAKDDFTKEEHASFVNFLNQCNSEDYLEILNKWQNALEQHELSKLRLRKSAFKRPYKIISIAAVLLALISIGIYLYSANAIVSSHTSTIAMENDLKPGGNKAILTLEDGTVINLDSANNGEIANQNGVVVSKAADGQLVYNLNLSQNLTTKKLPAFNTISTPKGGQYQIVLPDGSKVWLNAESSLKYPVSFSGNERRVELIGEGYFEIKKNPEMPFRVLSDKQLVTVLGTHFNINAYSDEDNIKTTLVEGAIQIENSGKKVILKPGEQAIVKDYIQVQKINTALSIAWKNGDFIFKNENIKSIMRQVSRWYNIDIGYVGENNSAVFGGIVSKSRNLSSVLQMLESTGKVKFEVLENNPAKDQERRIKVILE